MLGGSSAPWRRWCGATSDSSSTPPSAADYTRTPETDEELADATRLAIEAIEDER
jgi:hypothetical protein